MSIQAYRANLREAQEALAIAQTLLDEYKTRDLISWGTTAKGFEGWLVKGKKADEVYSNYVRAKADVEHWGGLLNGALRLQSVPQDPRLPPEKDDDEPMTAEQVEARKADLNAQFEAWQARNAGPV